MNDPAGLIVRDATPSSWSGQNCAVSASSTELIRDTDAWKALWKRAFGSEAPKVDFSETFALAVFVGTRNTGGFGVEFLPPKTDNSSVMLDYRLSAPSPAGFVTMAFTSPYAIQLYKKTNDAVVPRAVK